MPLFGGCSEVVGMENLCDMTFAGVDALRVSIMLTLSFPVS